MSKKRTLHSKQEHAYYVRKENIDAVQTSHNQVQSFNKDVDTCTESQFEDKDCLILKNQAHKMPLLDKKPVIEHLNKAFNENIKMASEQNQTSVNENKDPKDSGSSHSNGEADSLSNKINKNSNENCEKLRAFPDPKLLDDVEKFSIIENSSLSTQNSIEKGEKLSTEKDLVASANIASFTKTKNNSYVERREDDKSEPNSLFVKNRDSSIAYPSQNNRIQETTKELEIEPSFESNSKIKEHDNSISVLRTDDLNIVKQIIDFQSLKGPSQSKRDKRMARTKVNLNPQGIQASDNNNRDEKSYISNNTATAPVPLENSTISTSPFNSNNAQSSSSFYSDMQNKISTPDFVPSNSSKIALDLFKSTIEENQPIVEQNKQEIVHSKEVQNSPLSSFNQDLNVVKVQSNQPLVQPFEISLPNYALVQASGPFGDGYSFSMQQNQQPETLNYKNSTDQKMKHFDAKNHTFLLYNLYAELEQLKDERQNIKQVCRQFIQFIKEQENKNIGNSYFTGNTPAYGKHNNQGKGNFRRNMNRSNYDNRFSDYPSHHVQQYSNSFKRPSNYSHNSNESRNMFGESIQAKSRDSTEDQPQAFGDLNSFDSESFFGGDLDETLYKSIMDYKRSISKGDRIPNQKEPHNYQEYLSDSRLAKSQYAESTIDQYDEENGMFSLKKVEAMLSEYSFTDGFKVQDMANNHVNVDKNMVIDHTDKESEDGFMTNKAIEDYTKGTVCENNSSLFTIDMLISLSVVSNFNVKKVSCRISCPSCSEGKNFFKVSLQDNSSQRADEAYCRRCKTTKIEVAFKHEKPDRSNRTQIDKLKDTKHTYTLIVSPKLKEEPIIEDFSLQVYCQKCKNQLSKASNILTQKYTVNFFNFINLTLNRHLANALR